MVVRSFIVQADTFRKGWMVLVDTISDGYVGFSDVLVSPEEDLDWRTVIYGAGLFVEI